MRTRIRTKGVPSPIMPTAPTPNREVHCFVNGLWTGLGLASLAALGVWLAVKKVREVRDERTLPSRMSAASNETSFTIGDYSGMYDNADFREQALRMEDAYATRQRNLAEVHEHIHASDLRGRTEMKPWLEVE